MKQRVNHIKQREYYRPLAPIFREEDLAEYLDTSTPSPYMTLVANVLKEKQNKVSSIVHVDGTARYQSINITQNPHVYALLTEFFNATGESVLLNTSLNQHDEPIVESPEDAIKMFLASDLDCLVIEDYEITKKAKHTSYVYSQTQAVAEYHKHMLSYSPHHVLIEVILTHQCNKRCGYCDLNFENVSLSTQHIDTCITFLKNNPASKFRLIIDVYFPNSSSKLPNI